MQQNFKKISVGLCGVAVIAGSMTVSIPMASASSFGTQVSSLTSTGISVVPNAPTFSNTSLKYTIPVTEGVTYFVNGEEKSAGTYSVTIANPDVNVTARSKAGYEIPSSATKFWAYTFTFQIVAVSPTAPSFSDTAKTYTIPSNRGVVYKMNGVVTNPGTYTYSGSSVATVTATPAPGFVFASGSVTEWSFSYYPDRLVTAQPPIFNKDKKTYTIQDTTSGGYYYTVNGVTKTFGEYSATGPIEVKAVAKTGYAINGTSTWSFDFTDVVVAPAIQKGDLVAVDASGNLWNYGTFGKVGRSQIGSGWSDASQVIVTDWNADGIEDIIAKWNNGNLTVSYGTNQGTLSNTNLIGTGWSSFDVAVSHWNKLGIPADKFPSVIAKDSAGNLWQYHNTNGTTLNTRELRGTGWQGLQLNLLDWDKDGSMDIIAKNAAGQMVLYRTDNGTFKNEARPVIGTEWGNLETKAIAGYKALNSFGILAKDASGNLYYYGTENSTWNQKVLIGSGWTAMRIASS